MDFVSLIGRKTSSIALTMAQPVTFRYCDWGRQTMQIIFLAEFGKKVGLEVGKIVDVQFADNYGLFVRVVLATSGIRIAKNKRAANPRIETKWNDLIPKGDYTIGKVELIKNGFQFEIIQQQLPKKKGEA